MRLMSTKESMKRFLQRYKTVMLDVSALTVAFIEATWAQVAADFWYKSDFHAISASQKYLLGVLIILVLVISITKSRPTWQDHQLRFLWNTQIKPVAAWCFYKAKWRHAGEKYCVGRLRSWLEFFLKKIGGLELFRGQISFRSVQRHEAGQIFLGLQPSCHPYIVHCLWMWSARLWERSYLEVVLWRGSRISLSINWDHRFGSNLCSIVGRPRTPLRFFSDAGTQSL